MDGLWVRSLAGDRSTLVNDLVALLERQGISLRQDDGELQQLNVSIPTSVTSAFVLGLRYVERDGTQAEDHFTFEPGRPISCYYRGTLERRWPEYQGTHKQQVLFTLVEDDRQALPTPVNTITVIPGFVHRPTAYQA